MTTTDEPRDWETLRSDLIAAVRKASPADHAHREAIVDAVLSAVNLPWRLDERELETRAKIAADLRRAADGRREYAGTDRCDRPYREQLVAEASALESSASVAEDPARLLGLIPSWRWTAEEVAAVQAGTRAALALRLSTDRDERNDQP